MSLFLMTQLVLRSFFLYPMAAVSTRDLAEERGRASQSRWAQAVFSRALCGNMVSASIV